MLYSTQCAPTLEAQAWRRIDSLVSRTVRRLAFYCIYLRIVFAKMEFRPSKSAKADAKGWFHGLVSVCFRS